MPASTWRASAVAAVAALAVTAGLAVTAPAASAATTSAAATAAAAAHPRVPVRKVSARPVRKPTVKRPVVPAPARPTTTKPALVPVAPVVAPVAPVVAPVASAAASVAPVAGTVPAVTAASTSTGPALGLPVNAAELTPAQLDTVLDMARAVGATTVTSGAVWWFLTERGGARRYDWSSLDRLVAAASARGLSVDLQLSGTPDFVHPGLAATVPSFWDRIWYAPRTPAELAAWSAFVGDTVAHFGGKVARYELWNEPNIEEFWKTGPDATEYAALLRAGYLAAKAAAPTAVVGSAGLSRNDVGYAEAMYRALAAYPDAAAHAHFFDELGVHPYSDDRGPDVDSPRWVHEGKYGTVDDNFLGLRRMVALLAAHGEPTKKVFVGEYGFSTTRTWMAPVPDDVRAGYARRALELVRTMPQVSGFVWYHFVPTSTDDAAWTMATVDGATSATYRALAAAARSAV